MQLHHKDHSPSDHKFPIILVCDSLSNAANVGGLLRLGDAFAVSKIYFVGNATPLGRKMKKASRSTENYVEFEIIDSGLKLLKELKSNGHYICALEITDKSFPLATFQFRLKKELVIVVGNEIEGVSDELITIADSVLHVQMYGKNSSMNVVSSTAIILYEATRQYARLD